MACIREGPFSRIEKLSGRCADLDTVARYMISWRCICKDFSQSERFTLPLEGAGLKGCAEVTYRPVDVKGTYMEVTASRTDPWQHHRPATGANKVSQPANVFI